MAGELVLLTGGTGFLGHAILIDLLKNGYRVRAAVRSQAKIDKVLAAPSIAALKLPATQLMFVIVPDMIAPGAYDEAVQGVDFIIHAAAPVHSKDEKSDTPKEELERLFVTTCVTGNLAILKAANEKTKTVRRIVITSSTVAIAPVEVYLSDTKEREVSRGPESRVAAPPPPYNSELEAYCVSKAAALNASEEFMRDSAPTFDLISIMPSLIFGADELATSTSDLRTGSTQALISTLLTGKEGLRGVSNAILCSDVARAHVKALDEKVKGNQSFILSVDAKWENTVPILKKLFPDAFKPGFFQEDGWQPATALQWDTSKVREILDIDLASYESMLQEVVGQYLELAKKESK
ncbi:NAD(P)-binding protein [Thozetella sp. PMI_491]|nr:NAD(P)-binding protein [Thozetella sp. PMI_491]